MKLKACKKCKKAKAYIEFEQGKFLCISCRGKDKRMKNEN